MPPPLPLLAAFQVSVTVNDQDYTPLALFGDAKAFDFVYYEQPTLWCAWPLSLSVGGACLLRTCTCLCMPTHAHPAACACMPRCTRLDPARLMRPPTPTGTCGRSRGPPTATRASRYARARRSRWMTRRIWPTTDAPLGRSSMYAASGARAQPALPLSQSAAHAFFSACSACAPICLLTRVLLSRRAARDRSTRSSRPPTTTATPPTTRTASAA